MLLATTLSVEDEGATLRMVGNTWKKLGVEYTVTPDTVLEFDFASSQQGEVHALGFDTDDSASARQMFQLYGSHTWGIQAYRDYDPGHGTQHFVIPVGTFFTGDFDRLVLANDDDGNVVGESVFSNLRIYDALLMDVNDTYEPHEVEGYGKQDVVATTLSVEDQGATLRMVGNTWKKLGAEYTVTPDTVLEFDFASSQQGEVHAIGFDTDDSASARQMFQLYGSDTCGIQAYRNYDPANGLQHFVIPVGEFFTGDFDRLVLANDDDANALGGECVLQSSHLRKSAGCGGRRQHPVFRGGKFWLSGLDRHDLVGGRQGPHCAWWAIPGRSWG